MNLPELKAKATASELTLIEKVEELLREEVKRDAWDVMKRRMQEFILKNPPRNYLDLGEWATNMRGYVLADREGGRP